jgi:LCP family protein required for cell wall assembly
MARRARWLIILNLLIPGSAQLLAGSKRFARLIFITWFATWAVLLLLILLFLLNRAWLFSLFVSPQFTPVICAVLGFAAVWVFLVNLDTFRLIKFGRLNRFGAWFGLLSTLGVGVLVASLIGSAVNIINIETDTVRTIFKGNSQSTPNAGRYNILLLGGDAGADRFGLRPDSISVLSIDAATGDTVNIGIPRNLQRVPFVKGSVMRTVYPNGWSCGVVCLINAIYKDVTDNHSDLYPNAVANGSTPGVEATKDAVEAVTGLTINSYVLVDMAGFQGLIDSLGGVTIKVTQRLPVGGGEDINGQPINVRKWIEPGVQHLNGKYALWYARARHGTSDYDRMRRQRIVEAAVLKQTTPSVILSRFKKISHAGEKLVKTDIPSSMLGTYLDLALKAKASGIRSLELVPPKIDVIYPNFSEIRAMIQKAMTLGSAAR